MQVKYALQLDKSTSIIQNYVLDITQRAGNVEATNADGAIAAATAADAQRMQITTWGQLAHQWSSPSGDMVAQ